MRQSEGLQHYELRLLGSVKNAIVHSPSSILSISTRFALDEVVKDAVILLIREALEIEANGSSFFLELILFVVRS